MCHAGIPMHQELAMKETAAKPTQSVGVEFIDPHVAQFRVWAPKCHRIDLCILKDGQETPHRMTREEDGHYTTIVASCEPGTRYGYRLDGGEMLRPDPRSRFQPDGVFGDSQVIDPNSFAWSDQIWRGITPAGQVFYEMHVGTFTPEGTWESAARELPELARAGMTVIELMPVAEFAGRYGWGYDGVLQFAPTRLYGRPDDMRRFVDRAHALGLGVILDVVYNHFGCVGNYLREFSDNYISDQHENEWSEAVNFDGPHSGPVRQYFLDNVRHWIKEYHLDGFRIDATHALHDASPRHILLDISQTARAAAAPRSIVLTGENGPQDVRLLRPEAQGGYELDMLWNDDFHHSARVRLTGASEAYYSDFRGNVTEFLTAVKSGFLYQGQRSFWQKRPRGTPTQGMPAMSFVSFIENHDQIANTGTGSRVHALTSPGRHRAMTALWLLSPQTPMFLQGQEFSASNPFLYFADFQGEEAKGVAKGRIGFLSQFPSLATPEAQQQHHDPCDPEVFRLSKLDLSERETHREIYEMHMDLLKLRRDDPVFKRQRADLLDGAVLGPDCLAVRYFEAAGDDRLLLVNFGGDLLWTPQTEPLLAPPLERRWEQLWSSQNVQYGGRGSPEVETDEGWRIPAEATVVLRAVIPESTTLKEADV